MVGNNKAAVYNYVENQLKEDMMSDQVTIYALYGLSNFSFFIVKFILI